MTHHLELSPSATLPAGVSLLEQCRGFLETLDGRAYTRGSDVMFGGTIGQHVRHALDHFGAVLGALDGRVVDYDHRARGTEVETSLLEAKRTIDGLCALLRSAPREQADRPVLVRVMLSGEGDETELTSTFAREVAFATHHAIHHHAMMAAIASSFGLAIPAGFGKAPSTVNHERTAGAG